MNKLLLTLCLILLAATLTIGGVFAVFQYAQSDATPGNKNITAELEEFVYGYPPGFTKNLQSILSVAEKDKTYGLNASDTTFGMKKAILHSQVFGGRIGLGYVGTMDNLYGDDVYGKDKIESVSVIIAFSKKIDGVSTIYMYIVKKSKAELAVMNENDTLYNVYRATFIKDDAPESEWELRKLQDGSPDVVKGYSLVKDYERQTDGSKTFGCHNNNNTDIWHADENGIENL